MGGLLQMRMWSVKQLCAFEWGQMYSMHSDAWRTEPASSGDAAGVNQHSVVLEGAEAMAAALHLFTHRFRPSM